ncbi:MAG: hypothetical protein Q9188_007306 [Gyalolechia gomerana]
MMTNSIPSSLQPSPISWQPSQYWESDGRWSSFALQIGSPAQIVRVLISTAGVATWVISNLGCPPDFPPYCSQYRGGLFNSDHSLTWNQKGFFSLALETNLHPADNATYGLETVALGFTNATGGPVLENQVVAALSGSQYVMGTFGLGQQPTSVSHFAGPHPSFLTTLYNKAMIPSLSWSYTAGAKYRLTGVFGSLTLGGYDATRFNPSNISFDLATDISRDLLVGLQSITSTESNNSTHLLLPSAHFTLIDSTVPEIYLPLEACQLFERVFGLVWNATYGMYLVDDPLHDILVTRSPSFIFKLGNSITDGPTVEVTLPYDSFDLSFQPEIDSTPVRYFPIQRAANESQLALGRTFLQEAYLTTDYERGNFSVSQCKFEEPIKPDIIPILSENAKFTTDSNPEIGTNSWNLLRELPDNFRAELPADPGLYELSHEARSTVSEGPISRIHAGMQPQTPLSLSRRQGVVMSIGGHLSTYSGLRTFRTEAAASEEQPASAQSLESYLSKSLPATPVSENPRESAFPTWARIARHQHEEPGLRPPPLRLPERLFQLRRGFF